MIKKTILLAGLLALSANAFAATYTLSGYTGNWTGNSTLSNLVDNDRVTFSSGCNVSISTAIAKSAWITVGYQNNGGTLSILSGGSYVSAGASNMTFGLNPNGVGALNLSGSFQTTGAIYFGQNGGTGTASITGGTLSTSNTIWVGRSQGTATSSGVISMTSGTIVGSTAMNIAGYSNAAVTSGTQMNGYVDLQGGTLRAGSLVMGNASAGVSNANLTVSSAMTQATVTGAFTMNAASHLTLSAAADTDWTTKGAILAVGTTFSVSSTSTIVLNLSDFDGWDGMKAGDKITIKLLSYTTLNVSSGAPTISAEGLSSEFTLGTFNLGTNLASVDVTYAPIPEPAVSAALLGLSALALAVRRRRETKTSLQ